MASLRASLGFAQDASAVAQAAAAFPATAPLEPAEAGEPAAPADPVDYDAVARRMLGSPCPPSLPGCDDVQAGLDEAQQEELRLLVREAARLGIRRARAQSADVRVTWVKGATPRGEGVVDVLVEGSSLVRNWYVQIRAMLRDPSKGYPVVVERLRRKIARDG